MSCEVELVLEQKKRFIGFCLISAGCAKQEKHFLLNIQLFDICNGTQPFMSLNAFSNSLLNNSFPHIILLINKPNRRFPIWNPKKSL